MRKLYMLSALLDGKPRCLIGELTENNGKYSFKYRLGTGELPEWFLRIKEFPDTQKIYGDEDVRKLFSRMIPAPNGFFIKEALETAGLTEYGEWKMIKYCGKFGTRQNDVYFFENIPDGTILYG
jgi:hypothetical protein